MAKLNNTTIQDVTNKMSIGVASTTNDKNYFEEKYEWSPQLDITDIFAQSVPVALNRFEADLNVTNNSTIISKVIDYELSEIPGSNGQGYSCFVNVEDTTSKRLTCFLTPQKFGNGYAFTLKDNNDSIIPLTAGAYQFDYNNGVLRFNEGNTPSDEGWVLPLKLTAYRYIGVGLNNYIDQLVIDRIKNVIGDMSTTTPTHNLNLYMNFAVTNNIQPLTTFDISIDKSFYIRTGNLTNLNNKETDYGAFLQVELNGVKLDKSKDILWITNTEFQLLNYTLNKDDELSIFVIDNSNFKISKLEITDTIIKKTTINVNQSSTNYLQEGNEISLKSNQFELRSDLGISFELNGVELSKVNDVKWISETEFQLLNITLNKDDKIVVITNNDFIDRLTKLNIVNLINNMTILDISQDGDDYVQDGNLVSLEQSKQDFIDNLGISIELNGVRLSKVNDVKWISETEFQLLNITLNCDDELIIKSSNYVLDSTQDLATKEYVNNQIGLSIIPNTISKTDSFVIDNTIINDGFIRLNKTPISIEQLIVNLNGIILFEGSNEDYVIEGNRIVFTFLQQQLLTINDKVQVKYKY